jgi:hypothetical protein
MKEEYIVKLTQTEVVALFMGCGSVPFDDNTSSLGKIYNYITDNICIISNNERPRIRSLVKYDKLTKCMI